MIFFTEEEKLGLINKDEWVWLNKTISSEHAMLEINNFIKKYDKEFYEKYKLLFERKEYELEALYWKNTKI